MAAIVVGDLEAIVARILGSGPIGKGVATGLSAALAGIGASDLLNYLQGGSANAKAAKSLVQPYALLDVKNNKIVAYMGTRRAYRFLIRPRRRAERTKIVREIVREAR